MDAEEEDRPDLELRFQVSALIGCGLHEAYEAVADPEKLSGYFATGGAQGRLETGATVTWDFHDFPGAFPVKVVEAVPDRRIVLQWEANEAPPNEGAATEPARYDTMVTMTFEEIEDGRTRVVISEEGWRKTPAGLKASYGNCGGWMQMLCALKVYLEHGINLRQGMFT